MEQVAKKIALPECPDCGAQSWYLNGFVTRNWVMDEGEPVLEFEYSQELLSAYCERCSYDAMEDDAFTDELMTYWFPM